MRYHTVAFTLALAVGVTVVCSVGRITADNTLGSGGIIVLPTGAYPGWPTGSAVPTGAWQGDPVRVGALQIAGLPNGNTIYYWYVKGLTGMISADSRTIILATDDWRWNSSYIQSNVTNPSESDTIELTATNGQRFRRQGTPIYGVVAVIAPTVEEQCLNPALRPQVVLQRPSGGGLVTWPVPDGNWFARTVSVDDTDGVATDVTADPRMPTTIIGRIWARQTGDTRPDPSIVGETLIQQSTFRVEVPGFVDDLSGQGIFIYPTQPPTPDTLIRLLNGVAYRKELTLTLGQDSASVQNSFNTFTQPIGPSANAPIPPSGGPTPIVLRFALLYVPGDTKFLPNVVEGVEGK